MLKNHRLYVQAYIELCTGYSWLLALPTVSASAYLKPPPPPPPPPPAI